MYTSVHLHWYSTLWIHKKKSCVIWYGCLGNNQIKKLQNLKVHQICCSDILCAMNNMAWQCIFTQLVFKKVHNFYGRLVHSKKNKNIIWHKWAGNRMPKYCYMCNLFVFLMMCGTKYLIIKIWLFAIWSIFVRCST